MRRILLILACLCGGGGATALPAAPTTRVFILAGQSNMEGKGDGGKLTAEERAALKAAQERILFAYNGQPPRPLDVTPAGGNKKRFGVDWTFGPEMFFGLRLAQAWPGQKILLIKRSLGATSLYGAWNPEWTAEQAAVTSESKRPHLYASLIADVRAVLASYPPGSYELSGMLWVQGEADGNARQFGQLPGDTYARNLENLIAHVRRDLAAPDLPFVMMQVGAEKVVAGMKAAAAATPRVTFVAQSKDPAAPNYLPTYPVGHYNYEGQKRIGSMMAAAYLRDYAGPQGPSSPR